MVQKISAAILDAKFSRKRSHLLTPIDAVAVPNHVKPYPSVCGIERNPCDPIGKSLNLLAAEEKIWDSDIFDIVTSVDYALNLP